MVLVTQGGGQISPVGIVLIVGFVIILIWAVRHDKKMAKQFEVDFKKGMDGKVAGSRGDFFLMTDNKLVVKYVQAKGCWCEVFPLENVSYIMTAHDGDIGWGLSLYDVNKKLIKGEKFIYGRKKAMKADARFFTKGEDIELRDFLLGYLPKAKPVKKYFKEV